MLYSLFREKPTWLPKVLLALILISSATFMGYAAYHESATFDESAHIPAGYSYLRYFDYRLNPEHPPLLKAIAAVPLLFLNLNFPTTIPAWQTDVNGQWAVGGNFFYDVGNDGALIVRLARIGPILITLLLALLIYVWSASLVGKYLGLIPAFLFAWSPNVLAHGHYVTTDVAAAFGIALAIMTFIAFLFAPSKRHLLYAGLAFGMAQLMKFSAVLLLPYFALIIALFYLFTIIRDWQSTDRNARLRRFVIRGLVYARSTIFVVVIGYVLVVYPVYFLFTYNYPIDRQVRDTETILARFGGGPGPTGTWCKPLRCPADLTIWSASHSITRPFAQYATGVLSALERSEGGNANYFLGKVSGTGTPTYFPTVYLLKEPLPILLFLLVALIVFVRGWWAYRKNLPWNERLAVFAKNKHSFTALALTLFVVVYWISSIRSPLNIGLRHLFPTLPLLYMLGTMVWERWIFGAPVENNDMFLQSMIMKLKELPRMIMKGAFLAFLLFWLMIETVIAAPYFLSYFNQIGGGTHEGYRYVTDSNYDWGQDLYYLKEFVDAHPEIDKIAVDYFGGGSPQYTLGVKEENWWSSRGNPADQGIHWFAVSVNALEGSIQPTKGFFERKPEDEYRWLTSTRPSEGGLGGLPTPDFRAGTSIFIYKL